MAWFMVAAGLLGALGVVLGAGAAHGFEAHLTPEAIGWVETASRYMLIHTLAILICTRDGLWEPRRSRMLASLFFLLGTVIFCGSLLCLAFVDWRAAGALAPIGGLFLILGWLMVAWIGIRTALTRIRQNNAS